MYQRNFRHIFSGYLFSLQNFVNKSFYLKESIIEQKLA